MMNIGVIVAGGTGERFGDHKQTMVLNNKPVYQYSLDVFNGSDLIQSRKPFHISPTKMIGLAEIWFT